MKDDNKTKEQLLNELTEMRQRIAELEASETERKRAEDLLRIQRDLGIALSSTSNLTEALDQLLEATFRIDTIDCGGVYLIDQITGELNLVFHKGLPPQFVKVASHYDAYSPQARLVMAGKPVYGLHPEIFPTTDEILQDEGLRALAVIPMKYEEQVVAVLNLASHTYDEIPVSACNALEAIAAQIGGVVARVKAEETLHLFKAIVEASSEAIAISDPEGQLVYINPAHEKLFGRPLEEARRTNYRDYYPPESVEILNRDVAPALARGESWEGELDVFDADGRRFQLWERADSLRDAKGKMLYGFGFMHDVTERKRTEEALRESEERFRSIYEESPIGIELYDPDGRLLHANKACLDIFGLSDIGEVKGFQLFEDPNVADEEKERLRDGETVRYEAPFDFEKVRKLDLYRTTKSGIIYLDVLITPLGLKGKGSPSGYLVQVQDITERKRAEEELRIYRDHLEELVEERTAELKKEIAERRQAEEALKESEERFRGIVERNFDAIAVVNSEGQLTYASPAVERITGYKPEELMGKHFQNHFAESEIPKAVQAFIAVLKGASAEGVQLKMLRKDGSTIYIESNSSPILKDREVIGIQGIYRDITERKRAEEALRESEERYRSLFEGAEDHIFIVDQDLRYVTVSPSALKAGGFTLEDVVGKGPRELFPEDAEFYLSHYRHALETGEHVQFERELRLPDGPHWFSVTLSPIKDARGHVTALTGISRDITKRKRAEEALRQHTAQLEALREVGLKLTAQLDLDVLLRSIISQVVELLGGTAGGLSLYRQDLDVLEWVVTVGSTAVPLGSVLHRGEGLSGKVWKTGEPLIVEDYQRWEGRASIYEELPSVAIVAVPIRWGEEFLGTLHVEDVPSHIFSPADAELLSLLATQAAIAIKNAQLYKQARQDAETKATLLEEVNHRVKNNLTAIIGLLYAERRRGGTEDQPAYHSLLDDLTSLMQGLSTVHGLLSASEWAPLPLDKLTRQIIQVALQMLPRDKRVSVDVTPSSVQVTPDQAHSLALVINELATNTVKYALPERRKAHIGVRIACEDEDDTVLFEFRDDGPGYPKEVLRLERLSVGLYLIQTMVRDDLGGELALRNDDGAVTTIRFKKDPSGF